MTPDTPLRDTAMSFERTVDTALNANVDYKKSYHYALAIGITPRDVVLYAANTMKPHVRDLFQHRMVQSPWAISRVAALVKAHRDPMDRGVHLITTPILNPRLRAEPWLDEDLAGCQLLDTV